MGIKVVDGIHRFGSRFVNWYVIEEDSRLTVVDAGLLGQWTQFVEGLTTLGRRLADVEAIVLTHAHVDHTGFAERARSATGAPVHVHPADTSGGRARKLPPLWLYALPSSWPWLVHNLRDLVLFAPPVKVVTGFADGDILDVPGRPRVLHTPGHTVGSCALHLPARRVLLSGDALVTYDPYLNRHGPRLLVDAVNENPRQAEASLGRLGGIGADLVLPGHGEPWMEGVARAVVEARAARTTGKERKPRLV